MNVLEMVVALFGGSFAGSFLGPFLLEKIQRRRHEREWVAPRLKILRDTFHQVDLPVISLRDLAVRCGCTDNETRALLVRLGGVGTTMTNGDEGWQLDKNRQKFVVTNIDEKK